MSVYVGGGQNIKLILAQLFSLIHTRTHTHTHTHVYITVLTLFMRMGMGMYTAPSVLPLAAYPMHPYKGIM